MDCCESGSTLRVFDPHCQPHRAESDLCWPRTADGAPSDQYTRSCIREQSLRFEQSPAGLTVEGALKRGEYELAGNVSSQFISGLLFALPLLAGRQHPPPHPAGGEPQLYRDDPGGPAPFRRREPLAGRKHPLHPGRAEIPALRLHRGGRLQSGGFPGGAGSGAGRRDPQGPVRRHLAGRRRHPRHPAPVRGRASAHRRRASCSRKHLCTAWTSTLPTAPTSAPC